MPAPPSPFPKVALGHLISVIACRRYEAIVDKKPDLREAFSMGPVAPLSARLRGLLKDEGAVFADVVNFCYQVWPI